MPQSEFSACKAAEQDDAHGPVRGPFRISGLLPSIGFIMEQKVLHFRYFQFKNIHKIGSPLRIQMIRIGEKFQPVGESFIIGEIIVRNTGLTGDSIYLGIEFFFELRGKQFGI